MQLVERIGVIGNGVLGGATARSWLEYAGEVRVYDIVPTRSTERTLDTIMECDFVFICLPTPAKEDGSCDLRNLENLCQGIAGCRTNLVLRSTVPPGTTRRLSEENDLPNLIHNPEFLTARCAGVGACLPSRNIIGWTKDSDTEGLTNLYEKRWPGVPVFTMQSDESELVKLICNAFFATKISFFNEMKQINDALTNDWEVVMDGVLSDGRIMPEHTEVPGPDGELGFGGSCLPKDLQSLIDVAMQNKVSPVIIYATLLKNGEVRNGR